MSVQAVALQSVADFDPPAPRDVFRTDNPAVAFMPMAAVLAENTRARTDQTRQAAQVLSAFTYFQSDDVLVAKITPCFENGKIALATIQQEHGFGSTEFHVIRADADRLWPAYLLHYLRQPWVRSEGERKMTGSAGQRRVPRHFLEMLKITLPPMEEQRRIAEILDQAEALRAKRREALAKLDTLTQSLFLEMFGDPALNPHSWRRTKLEDVCVLITDGEHLTPRRCDSGVKLLSARNVRNGFLDFTDVDYVDDAEYARIAVRCKPERGDVLISCSGTIGRVSAVRVDEPLALVRSAALVRPCQSITRTDYLESWLQTRGMKAEMKRRANASGQPNLFQNQIRQLTVLVPDGALQDRFVARRDQIDALRERHCESATRSDTLFQSLQHRAFRGEL